MLYFLLVSTTLAAPYRTALEKPARVMWHPGVSAEHVIIKLHDDVSGVPSFDGLAARPFVPVSHGLRSELERIAQESELPRLAQYFVLPTPDGDGADVAEDFNDMEWVELAYLASAPVPPPVDIAPVTPNFREEQVWLDPAPDGVDRSEGAYWPGGRGAAVAVADLEYSWDKDHEDYDLPSDILVWGHDSEAYPFHGTAVLGQLFADENDFGVDGLIPEAEPMVISPYATPDFYSVADALLGALEVLLPGDVVLIEQQAWANNNYAPVEVDPLVFDAIATVVAAGIVVVEPTGNGGQDLDSPAFEGIFDRANRDSGAILVGGGASPLGELPARTWIPGGSCYGERVDVQGWMELIVTTINGEYDGYYADLFFPSTEAYPDGDPRQAYTTQFGGTSGASPMVAGVAAIAQSVALTLHGEAFNPMELRALMVSTGTPQPEEDPYKIGPQPDARRLLRYALLP